MDLADLDYCLDLFKGTSQCHSMQRRPRHGNQTFAEIQIPSKLDNFLWKLNFDDFLKSLWKVGKGSFLIQNKSLQIFHCENISERGAQFQSNCFCCKLTKIYKKIAQQNSKTSRSQNLGKIFNLGENMLLLFEYLQSFLEGQWMGLATYEGSWAMERRGGLNGEDRLPGWGGWKVLAARGPLAAKKVPRWSCWGAEVVVSPKSMHVEPWQIFGWYQDPDSMSLLELWEAWCYWSPMGLWGSDEASQWAETQGLRWLTDAGWGWRGWLIWSYWSFIRRIRVLSGCVLWESSLSRAKPWKSWIALPKVINW